MKIESDLDHIIVNNDGSFTIDREKLHQTKEYKRQADALKKLIEAGLIEQRPVFWDNSCRLEMWRDEE